MKTKEELEKKFDDKFINRVRVYIDEIPYRLRNKTIQVRIPGEDLKDIKQFINDNYIVKENLRQVIENAYDIGIEDYRLWGEGDSDERDQSINELLRKYNIT